MRTGAPRQAMATIAAAVAILAAITALAAGAARAAGTGAGAASRSSSGDPQAPMAAGAASNPPAQSPASPASQPAIVLKRSGTVPAAPRPMRADVQAFGAALGIEVRDLPAAAASAAIQTAVVEVHDSERLTDPARADGPLGLLNAAAGRGPQRLDPRLFDLLARALDFCQWSDGKEGPLGGDLHRAWGRGGAAPLEAPPAIDRLRQAVASASCRHLSLNAAQKTATLDEGSVLDLTDFAIGTAVDRAMAALRQAGSANAFVQIGGISRGIGGGRGGRGWAVEVGTLGGLAAPIGQLVLRDQALAIATFDEQPVRVAKQALSPFINQRTGMPADGVVATLAATELAVDAQALAATLTITGSSEGELLMGSIRPRPAVLWLMGSGGGAPLLVDYRWSEVAKR